MVATLLERQDELLVLREVVDLAVAGHGRTVLLLGEAGIGKTTLVRAFVASLPRRARVLSGACEDLLTPRAFGPLREAASGSRVLTEAFAGSADPDQVLLAVMAELSAPPVPTVLVVEDAHWADGATLDVLRYVSRRVESLPAVLLVTYREDAMGREHPLRTVLGGLGHPATIRLRLSPLTPRAVTAMAGVSDLDGAELFRLTAGNPFFVSEVLAALDVVVPPTVVDAVLARVAKLSPAAQRALEPLAVVPAGAELDAAGRPARRPGPDRRGRAGRGARDARRSRHVPARVGAAGTARRVAGQRPPRSQLPGTRRVGRWWGAGSVPVAAPRRRSR